MRVHDMYECWFYGVKVVIQALRLLISFTTLNKFCDHLIKLTTANDMHKELCVKNS